VSTDFSVITEAFGDDLAAIRSLVNAFNDPHKSAPKARIAAANSATLLLAATFEEFVREMARAYARAVVTATDSFERLPSRLANTAWRRTMETLARIRIDTRTKVFSAESMFSDALTRFTIVYEFCKGDLSQDIYNELIYNENNMRPSEINSLFKVSDLVDVCLQLADKKPLLENFGESEPGKAHGRLLSGLEEFFERRNGIAHSLNPARSSGPDQIQKDIDMLDAFGKSLCATLESLAPKTKPAVEKAVPGTEAAAIGTPVVASDTPME
jgi:RiboL-PSP-HEPN